MNSVVFRAVLICSLSVCIAACGGGSKSNQKYKPKPGAKEFTNSIGMQFVRIEPGTFDMGVKDPPKPEEGPVKTVILSEPFYMGVTEVTQEQFQKIMGEFNPKWKDEPKLPANMLAWSTAQDFVHKLNAAEHCSNYRLPSEAEWEFCAKAGSTDEPDEAALKESAWCYQTSGDRAPGKGEEVADGETMRTLNCRRHDVASKTANAFGLYDMLGNVEEFCQDRFHKSGYENTPTDGSADESDSPADSGSTWRTLRGGSYATPITQLYTGKRHGVSDSYPWETFGMRVVYDTSPSKKESK
ncbi:MAG: formylglycine-generating enzyme family protein [Candidatus Obscuribacterales bacterium]|jgi:formylglycine-generating enzyme required for sulfatase activity|nr:formylglycine-generating enzyme family protein [Candidatus Obscuribacterales bacterium]